MTFTDYRIRYEQNYDRLNNGHNAMYDKRTGFELKTAYNLHTNPYSPYYKKLSPTILAKSDVRWTSAQIHAAVDWAWDYNVRCYAEGYSEEGQNKDDMLNYLLGCSAALDDLMYDFFRKAF